LEYLGGTGGMPPKNRLKFVSQESIVERGGIRNFAMAITMPASLWRLKVLLLRAFWQRERDWTSENGKKQMAIYGVYDNIVQLICRNTLELTPIRQKN